jgi:chromosome segregation ATPase
MFAFLGGTLGKYLFFAIGLIIIVGSAFLYIKYTTDKITALNERIVALDIQAKSLQAANDSLEQNVAQVQAAQTETNRNLENIRVTSAQTAANIRNQILSVTNPVVLQGQVNKNMAATLKALQDLSRAP